MSAPPSTAGLAPEELRRRLEKSEVVRAKLKQGLLLAKEAAVNNAALLKKHAELEGEYRLLEMSATQVAEELEAEKAEAEARAQAEERRRVAAEAAAAEARGQFQECRAGIAALRAEMAALRAKAPAAPVAAAPAAAPREVAALREQNRRLEAELAAVRREVGGLKAAVEAGAQRGAAAEREAPASEQLQGLQAHVDALAQSHARILASQLDAGQLEARVGSMQGQLQQQGRLLADYGQRSAGLQQQMLHFRRALGPFAAALGQVASLGEEDGLPGNAPRAAGPGLSPEERGWQGMPHNPSVASNLEANPPDTMCLERWGSPGPASCAGAPSPSPGAVQRPRVSSVGQPASPSGATSSANANASPSPPPLEPEPAREPEPGPEPAVAPAHSSGGGARPGSGGGAEELPQAPHTNVVATVPASNRPGLGAKRAAPEAVAGRQPSAPHAPPAKRPKPTAPRRTAGPRLQRAPSGTAAVPPRADPPGGVIAVGQSKYRRVAGPSGKQLAAAARAWEGGRGQPAPAAGPAVPPRQGALPATRPLPAATRAATTPHHTAPPTTPQPHRTTPSEGARAGKPLPNSGHKDSLDTSREAEQRRAEAAPNPQRDQTPVTQRPNKTPTGRRDPAASLRGLLFGAASTQDGAAAPSLVAWLRAALSGGVAAATAAVADGLLECASAAWLREGKANAEEEEEEEEKETRCDRVGSAALAGWCQPERRPAFRRLLDAAASAGPCRAELLGALRTALLARATGLPAGRQPARRLGATQRAAAAVGALGACRALGCVPAGRAALLAILTTPGLPLADEGQGSGRDGAEDGVGDSPGEALLLVVGPAVLAWPAVLGGSGPLQAAVAGALGDLCAAATPSGAAAEMAARLESSCGWRGASGGRPSLAVALEPLLAGGVSEQGEEAVEGGLGLGVRLLGAPWALGALLPRLAAACRRQSSGEPTPWAALDLLGAAGAALLRACPPARQAVGAAPPSPCVAVILDASLAVSAALTDAVLETPSPHQARNPDIDPKAPAAWRIAERAVSLAAAVAGQSRGESCVPALRLLSRLEAWLAGLPPTSALPRSLRRACDRAGMAVYAL
eukprot:jgi/Tetstr1/443032/TSEL_031092.t1